MNRNATRVVEGDEFHRQPRPAIYSGELGEVVVKRASQMTTVRYAPCHANADAEGDAAGRGETLTTWVFSEDGNTADGVSQTPFNLMVDFVVAPNGAIGLHRHDDKEEIYYLLEGQIRMTVVTAAGEHHSFDLYPGDAHLIRLGQAHYGVAGPQGARMIAVCVRPA